MTVLRDDPLRLRRVLCALDAESTMRARLSVAGAFAQGFGASVDALYVSEPAPHLVGTHARVRRLIAEHNARESFQSALVPYGESLRVDQYMTRGRRDDVILAHSQAHRADLIVLGSGGAEGDDAASLVASSATCAVLTVRGSTPELSLRRALLPIGSALAAEPALDWAIALASRFGVSITLANVPARRSGIWRAWSGWSNAASSPPEEHELHALRERALARLRDAGVPASLHDEDVDAQGIAGVVTRNDFDLVLIGLQAGGAESDVLARAVRARCDVPVLSARDSSLQAHFIPNSDATAHARSNGWGLGMTA